MRMQTLAALSMTAVFTAGMLTGCPWQPGGGAGPAPSSSSPSSSSSSSSRPSYDDGDDDDGDDDGGDDSSSASSDPVEDVKEDVVISEDGTHYTVYTTAGFTQWATAAATGPSIDCTLEGDIDLTGTPWISIGSTYTGTFDGQGHSISGLSGGCGLFAYIGAGGAVKNVKLENVNFSADTGYYAQCGGVAAKNQGTISGCTVSGTITSDSDSGLAGGIAGYNNGGTIQGCFFSGMVTSTENSSRAGGIAGQNSTRDLGNDFIGDIKGCCVAGGTVTANGSDSYAGGIAGSNYGVITDCYWRKGPDNAVDLGSGEATEQLTNGNLDEAIDAMNDALGENFGYKYVTEGGNPVLQPMTAANLLAQYFGLTLPL